MFKQTNLETLGNIVGNATVILIILILTDFKSNSALEQL